MTEVKPFAFVLMPFSSDFDDIYKYGIKKTAEELGIVAERVDEQHFSETILERVYRQIENSDFIVADMTGKNANVFYEVGYAHAKGKLCALVTQSATDIPFDLKHHTHVIYDGTIGDLAEKLLPKLEWLKAETERLKTETISFTATAKSPSLGKSDWADSGKFDLVMNLKNTSSRRSPEIEAIYITTTKGWRIKTKGSDCPSEPVGEDKRLRRHLITPSLRRLSPSAFAEETLTFSRNLWTKSSGDERKETYNAKGTVSVEVLTSEGTLVFEKTIEVEFDEIPF